MNKFKLEAKPLDVRTSFELPEVVMAPFNVAKSFTSEKSGRSWTILEIEGHSRPIMLDQCDVKDARIEDVCKKVGDEYELLPGAVITAKDGKLTFSVKK